MNGALSKLHVLPCHLTPRLTGETDPKKSVD